MKVFIVLSVLIAVAVSQYEPQGPPIPYSFNYISDTEDGGRSSHQEAGDGAGRVTGSYTVNDLEGHERIVEYIADEGGFRATIRTNEPGTASLNPADVVVESSAPQEGAAIAYSLGTGGPIARPAAQVAPVGPSAGGRGRYVLVPDSDPRARGYY